MAEERIYQYISSQNRPFNAQNVADMMAQFGIKKTAVEKSLASLADKGKLVCKEFGKAKIYFPNQEGLPEPNKEEQERKKQQIKKLQEQVTEASDAVRAKERDLASLRGSMSVSDMTARVAQLETENAALEKRLAKLRTGGQLVTAEQRAAAERRLREAVDAWRKRRGIYREITDALFESIDTKVSILEEEIGVERDEGAGVSFADATAMVNDMQAAAKRRK